MTFNRYTSHATRRAYKAHNIEYIASIIICLVVVGAALLWAGHGEQTYFKDLGVIEIK